MQRVQSSCGSKIENLSFSELGLAKTLTPGSIETKILKSSLLLNNSTLTQSNLRTLNGFIFDFTLPDGDFLIPLDDQTDSTGA